MSYKGAYPLWNYGWMMGDKIRNDAYYNALKKVITPDSVVADVGAGAGLFSLLACQLGAKKVYAIEPSPAVWLAGDLAEQNGYGGRVECLQGLSTEITLPEQMDVVVSDLRSFLPFHLEHLTSISDIKQRMLKPDGRLIPSTDKVYVAVVQAQEAYERCIAPWGEVDFGLDFSAMQSKLLNTMHKLYPRESVDKLSPSIELISLDYNTCDDPNLRAQISTTIEKTGVGHGLSLWFDSYLDDEFSFSNDLGGPELIYGAAFLPWERPLSLQSGDTLKLDVAASLVGDHYVWNWNTSLKGAEEVCFRQSTFYGSLLSPSKK